MDIGASELIIVLVVVLLLFGGSKVPELARSLGKAQSEFKRGLGGGSDDPAPIASKPAPTEFVVREDVAATSDQELHEQVG